MQAGLASAQTTPTLDPLPGGTTKIRVTGSEVTFDVQNTGCDNAHYADSTNTTRLLTAFVWDGDSSGTGGALMCRYQEGYDYSHTSVAAIGSSITATLPGVVSDPDVVVNRDPSANGWFICVVYTLTPTNTSTPSRVYSEIWQFTEPSSPTTPGTLALVNNTATRMYRSATTSEAAEHSNVDAGMVNGVCQAVMVYDQAGNINACTRPLSGLNTVATTPSPVTLSKRMSNPNASYIQGRNTQPDISIATSLFGTNTVPNVTATYIFIGTANQSPPNVYKPQMGASTVRFDNLASTATSIANDQKRLSLDGNTSFNLTFANPRIAFTNDKFFITYERTNAVSSPTVRAIGLAILEDFFAAPTAAPSWSLVTMLSRNGSEALNTHPVVVPSAGSSVVLAWRHFNSEVDPSELTSHIIACSPGSQTTGTFAGDFWRVTDEPAPNTFGSLSYRAPSLTTHPSTIYDGGAINEVPLPNVLYFWYDQTENNVPAVAYRLGGGGNLGSRPGKRTWVGAQAAPQGPSQVTLAPNPATPESRVGVALAVDERLVSLTVVSLLTGQPVATVSPGQLKGLTILANLLPESAQPGLYAARLTTTRGTTTTTFRFDR